MATTITKSDLKAVIKECLIEILSEGLGNSLQSAKRIPSQQENPYLDEKRMHPVKNKPASHLHEFIKKETAGNKMMEDIFLDTAASALPKMLQSEAKGAIPVKHNLTEQAVSDTSPEELFGEEIVSKWANYAFGNTTIK